MQQLVSHTKTWDGDLLSGSCVLDSKITSLQSWCTSMPSFDNGIIQCKHLGEVMKDSMEDDILQYNRLEI